MNLQCFRNSLISLRYIGEPSGTRTRDPLIKSQMLYRPELTAQHSELKNPNLYRDLCSLEGPAVPEIAPIRPSFFSCTRF